MKTFLSVNFALAPFAVLWTLLAVATPGIALATGLLVSAACCGWGLYKHQIRSLEIGCLTIFLILGFGDLISPDFVGANVTPLSFAGLGLSCLVTVALGRPWTADYSRAEFPQVDQSQIFQAVNMILSALWGVLFLLLALARMLHAGAWVTTGIVVAGAPISIFGPKLLIRLAIRRRIASYETYRWPAPSLGGARDNGDVDVAVVGAGIGGLTAAALLADAGLKVVVAEHHAVPGGFCHTFVRKAHHQGNLCLYRFDSGPHDFSGLWPGGPVDSVLQRLGVAQRLDWRRLDHTYCLGSVCLDVPRDWHDYVRELGRLFPASATGLETLFADIRTIYDSIYATGHGNGGIPGPPLTVEATLAFPCEHPLAFHWLDRPFDQLVAQHIQDPGARRMLSALAGYISDGHEVLTCQQIVPLFGYYFHGGYYPAGGSGRLSDVLVEAIEERSGKLRLKAPVAQIAVEHGRVAGVVLGDATRVRAKAVVSNADVKRTFLGLIEARI